MSRALLDTNLLLLLIVGTFDPARVTNHARLSAYSEEDLGTLLGLLEPYSLHISLPNILTEASNLLKVGHPSVDPRLGSAFAAYCQNLDEVYQPSRDVTATEAFVKFGLTDAAIVRSLRADVTILTDDYALSGVIASAGGRVINIRHSQMPQ